MPRACRRGHAEGALEGVENHLPVQHPRSAQRNRAVVPDVLEGVAPCRRATDTCQVGARLPRDAAIEAAESKGDRGKLCRALRHVPYRPTRAATAAGAARRLRAVLPWGTEAFNFRGEGLVNIGGQVRVRGAHIQGRGLRLRKSLHGARRNPVAHQVHLVSGALCRPHRHPLHRARDEAIVVPVDSELAALVGEAQGKERAPLLSGRGAVHLLENAPRRPEAQHTVSPPCDRGVVGALQAMQIRELRALALGWRVAQPHRVLEELHRDITAVRPITQSACTPLGLAVPDARGIAMPERGRAARLRPKPMVLSRPTSAAWQTWERDASLSDGVHHGDDSLWRGAYENGHEVTPINSKVAMERHRFRTRLQQGFPLQAGSAVERQSNEQC
mmetsp:Transcript_67879/g.196451  ORF Transcript_67879/g.196451 Transcript_67879/m.196451 type:complete len:388 (+) Transcript_67879:569-1732(+)